MKERSSWSLKAKYVIVNDMEEFWNERNLKYQLFMLKYLFNMTSYLLKVYMKQGVGCRLFSFHFSEERAIGGRDSGFKIFLIWVCIYIYVPKQQVDFQNRGKLQKEFPNSETFKTTHSVNASLREKCLHK